MKNLADFGETVQTGMDPDNNGEIEMIIAINGSATRCRSYCETGNLDA